VPTGGSSGEFHLELWGRPLGLTYPDWNLRKIPSGEPASPMEQALVLYYFERADATAIGDSWISFSELPDGTFYNQAFQGYTGEELRRAFGNDLEKFERAAEGLGGERGPLGDLSYRFKALPRVSILVVYWLGDEDFPPSAQVLFDASASHYLPTDAYAILGSTITRRLIAMREK
jgi:hypothetical protein